MNDAHIHIDIEFINIIIIIITNLGLSKIFKIKSFVNKNFKTNQINFKIDNSY